VRLRQWLEQELGDLPVALLPGNHDHLSLLRAALGRRAWIAPAAVALGPWRLLLLSSHRPGAVEGWLEPRQLIWLEAELQRATGPLLVALHHPPVPIGGDSPLDAIGLQQPAALLDRLLACRQVRGVVFGHIHQHWQGQLERPGSGPALPLWGCPSTLAAFTAVQPCPLGRPAWPGGRWLQLEPGGGLSTRLLRWPPLRSA